MAAKPKRLTYHGVKVPEASGPDGEVLSYGYDRFFYGVPTRDLDEEDIRRLSDDTLKNIMGTPPGGKPLYTDPDAKKAKSDDKKSPEKETKKETKKAPEGEKAKAPVREEARDEHGLRTDTVTVDDHGRQHLITQTPPDHNGE